MHDDRLEDRLRAALRTEAEGLAFTITAEELRRRLVVRRRARVSRTSTLLLAAAVGVGLLGVGALAGGALDRRTAVPTSPPSGPIAPIAQASTSPASSTPPAAATLPTLDELIDDGGEAALVVAQANGASDGIHFDPINFTRLDPPSIALGPVDGSAEYQVSFACLGDTSGTISIDPVGAERLAAPPVVTCDGRVVHETQAADGPAVVHLDLRSLASWRLAVHRIGDALPGRDATEPARPEAPSDEDVLIETQDQPVQPDAEDVAINVGGLATRETYVVRLSCASAPTLEYFFGAGSGGVPTASTTAVVPCDGAVHEHRLGIGQLFGPELYVRAGSGARWGLVVSSSHVPIPDYLEVADDYPGWMASSGLGPAYVERSEEQGLSIVAHQLTTSGPVLVVVSCVGVGPMTGTVDLGVREGERTAPLEADCSPDGATTAKTYEVDGPNVSITYIAPARSYVSVTALEPKPKP